MASGTPVQCPATANFVEGEDANEGGEHVGYVVQTGHPLAISRTNASNLEDVRTVDGDTSDADPLLKDLQPDDELNTSGGVELALLDAEEHVDVAGGLRVLLLELADVANVLEFGFGELTFFAVVATEAAEDVAGFVFTTGLHKPDLISVEFDGLLELLTIVETPA